VAGIRPATPQIDQPVTLLPDSQRRTGPTLTVQNLIECLLDGL
jgi:hypothetical protein